MLLYIAWTCFRHEFLLQLQVLLVEVEYLFCAAPFCSETSLLFCCDLFRFWPESVYGDLQHESAWIAEKTEGSVVLEQLQVSFLLRVLGSNNYVF